jgi:hypothetical protein
MKEEIIIICEKCEKEAQEVWVCERCNDLICEDCQANYDQFSQIDFNCCKTCAGQ